MPRVYNKYHKDAPKDAVYVGRPSKWSNPFSHLPSKLAEYKVATREEAIKKYIMWIETRGILQRQIKLELKGKDLVCFCAPKPCHADILLKIANS